MFRFLLITACLAVPVFSYSTGAPPAICDNDLTPDHPGTAQTTAVPYSFDGPSQLASGEKLTLTLGGDQFLGFALQARDAKNAPIGSFKIVESNKSQTLDCKAKADTLTHVKIVREKPITSMKFDWVPPQNYKGEVTFYATVAKDGHTYWVRKVVKKVQVQ